MTDYNIEQEIIKLYKEGLSGKKIEEQTGVSASQVRRILKRNNVKARSNKTEDTLEKDIINKYNQGVSSEQIAKDLNLSASTVCRILKRNGIDIKGATHFNRKYELKENFFNSIDTDEKAYFLGFLYSNGYLQSNRQSIRFYIHKQDMEILLKFQSLIFEDNYEFKYIEEGNYISLYIYSSVMYNDLIKHGCTLNKDFNITLPMLQDNLMLPFLRGLYDGSGTIQHKLNSNNLLILITGNLSFLQSIQQYIAKHNIIGCLCYTEQDGVTTSFVINNKEDVKKMLDLLYKDSILYLPQNYKKYTQVKDIKS